MGGVMAREQRNAHENWEKEKKDFFSCHENHISMLL